jgi:hypothetical protein
MRLFAIALSVLVPAQAMALSCIPPSVERSFGYAQDAEELYVVVSGELTFDERKIPQRPKNPNNAPKLTLIPATLSGQSLSKAGFVTTFDQLITIELRCFGPWCGSVTSGAEHLAFMKKTDAGYTLNVDPCNSAVFSKPTPQMLDAVTGCMNGAKCSSEF